MMGLGGRWTGPLSDEIKPLAPCHQHKNQFVKEKYQKSPEHSTFALQEGLYSSTDFFEIQTKIV